MGEAQAACHPNAVSDIHFCGKRSMSRFHCRFRVINIFKSMITDDDVLEKEDSYILDRIRAFALSDEMASFAAAKILVLQIDRAVCYLFSCEFTLNISTCAERGRHSEESDHQSSTSANTYSSQNKQEVKIGRYRACRIGTAIDNNGKSTLPENQTHGVSPTG